MRDYLSRLVIKTLNQEEVIQPRLISLYEPPTINQPAFQKQFSVEKNDISSPERKFDHKTHSMSRQTSYKSTDHVPEEPASSVSFNIPDRLNKNEWFDHNTFSLPQQTSHQSTDHVPEEPASSEYFNLSDRLNTKEHVDYTTLPISQQTEYPSTDKEQELQPVTDQHGTPDSLSHKLLRDEPANYPDVFIPHVVDQTVNSKISILRLIEPRSAQLPGHSQWEKVTPIQETQSDSKQIPKQPLANITLQKTDKQPRLLSEVEDNIHDMSPQSTTGTNNGLRTESPIQPIIIKQSRSNEVGQSNSPHGNQKPIRNVSTSIGDIISQPEMTRREKSVHNIVKPAQKEPAIFRVNIGRIEVRAVQPPTPPLQHKSKQQEPRLSLDEYLRQRNGGML